MKKALVALTLIGILAVPFGLTLAYEEPGAEERPTTVATTMKGVMDLIENAMNWFFAILLVIASIMIIYAGFTFVTAAGNEEKIGTAKKMLTYGIVGIAVAVLAKSIPLIIKSFLGA